jgi:hypothetical protein
MITKRFANADKLFLLVLLLGSGCKVFSTTNPSQTSTFTSNPPLYAQTRIMETNLPALTTQTLSPTKTTELSTQTPLHTLTTDQEKELLHKFLRDNGKCRLPCLWGITPGKTEVDALNTLFLPFNNISIPSDFYVRRRSQEESGGVTFILWMDNIRIPITLTYYNNQARIEYASLTFEAGLEEGEGADSHITPVYGEPLFEQTLGYYRLSNILTQFGMPSDVLIAPFPDDPQYPVDVAIPFSVVLFYKTQGMFLEYISPLVAGWSMDRVCTIQSRNNLSSIVSIQPARL